MTSEEWRTVPGTRHVGQQLMAHITTAAKAA